VRRPRSASPGGSRWSRSRRQSASSRMAVHVTGVWPLRGNRTRRTANAEERNCVDEPNRWPLA